MIYPIGQFLNNLGKYEILKKSLRFYIELYYPLKILQKKRKKNELIILKDRKKFNKTTRFRIRRTFAITSPKFSGNLSIFV
jgi:hypothetical protein